MTSDARLILLYLPNDEAHALARYLQRVRLDDYRRLSFNELEARTLYAATERLRTALAAAGYLPH